MTIEFLCEKKDGAYTNETVILDIAKQVKRLDHEIKYLNQILVIEYERTIKLTSRVATLEDLLNDLTQKLSDSEQ